MKIFDFLRKTPSQVRLKFLEICYTVATAAKWKTHIILLMDGYKVSSGAHLLP